MVQPKRVAVLQAKDLTIGYGTQRIASAISFDLIAGEVLCLLGPNGSGKTTLFQSLLGLIPLLSGRVLVEQNAITHYSRQDIAKMIAYVPQAVTGLFAFKVLDMVLMGRAAHLGAFAAPGLAEIELAEQSLEQLGIAHLAQRSYTQLSGGEQQLVLLARALTQQPKALLLDEPTASLDFGNQIRVLEQIRHLAEQGIAVCLCTHQPEHAYRVADEVALLKKGQLMAVGTTATTLSVEALARLYDLPVAAVRQHLRSSING